MDTDPIDVTAILAQPREFARRYENMQAQLSLAQANIDKELAKANIEDAKRQHNAEVGRINAALANARFEIDATSALLTEAQAERDAARADLIHVAEQWHASEKALDAARAEVARLTTALTEADTSAQMMADEFYEVSECSYLIDPVVFDAHRQALRAALSGNTAPATGLE